MSYADTLAADYKLLAHDFGEQVTLTHQPGGAADTVSRAVRLEISRREVQAAGGLFTMQDAIWLLPAAELDSDPKEGDRITGADAVAWTILEAAQEAAGTVWRCVCRRER